MKRRAFISATSLTGAALVVGTPLTLLAQAPQLLTEEVKALKEFKNGAALGLEGQVNSQKILFELTTPAKIIKRKTTSDGFELSFKNYGGNHLKIISKKGVSSIFVS